MATKKREEKRFHLKVWIGEYLIYNTIHILTKEQCAYWAKKFLTDYDTYDVVGHQMGNTVLAGISTDEEKLAKVLKEHEDEIIILGMESHVWNFDGLFSHLCNFNGEFDLDFPDPEIKTIQVEPITDTEGLMIWECKRIMPPPPKKRTEKKKRGPSLAEVLGVDETILKKPITDLDLSVRGFNVLKSLGTETLGDVAGRFTENGIFSKGKKIKGVGPTTYQEIYSLLGDEGLLKEYTEGVFPGKDFKIPPTPRELTDEEIGDVTKKLTVNDLRSEAEDLIKSIDTGDLRGRDLNYGGSIKLKSLIRYFVWIKPSGETFFQRRKIRARFRSNEQYREDWETGLNQIEELLRQEGFLK